MSRQMLGAVVVLIVLAALTDALVGQAQSSAPGFINVQSPVSVHQVTGGQMTISGTAGGGHGVVNDCPTTPRTFIWERGELQNPAKWKVTPEGGTTVLLNGTFALNEISGQHPEQECGNGGEGQNFTYDFSFGVSVASLSAGRYTFTADTINADFGNRVTDSFVFEAGAAPKPKLETSIISPVMTYMSDDSQGTTTFWIKNGGAPGSRMDWRSRIASPADQWLVPGDTANSSQGLRPEDGWVGITVSADLPPRENSPIRLGRNVGPITITCVNHDYQSAGCQEPTDRVVEVLYNIDLRVELNATSP